MTRSTAKAIRCVTSFISAAGSGAALRPSVSITAKRSFTIIYTYATDIEKTIGNDFTQTAPGQGVLFHDVGNITFSGGTMTIHGPHDIFEEGDAAFCNALSAVS